MYKITDILFRTFRTNAKLIGLAIVLVILIAVSVWCYYRYAKPAISTQKQGNIPNYGKNETVHFYFFNVDWCPHCIKAKPEWERFCDKYDGTEINGYIISCVGGKNGTDCTKTEETEVVEIIQRFNVEHYPTLKLVKDSDVVEFDAKINYDNLEKFAQTVLAGN
jgi:thiol-disulfide isomerase/thioredoxin